MVGLVTFFCPCVTCGKTWHRLHYDGDMSGYEIVNAPVRILSLQHAYVHPILNSSSTQLLILYFLINKTQKQCIAYGYSIFCCTPLAHQFLVCIPNAWQTYRIRRIGDLGGTCAADCTKTWLCPCCSLIQNEKESKLLMEGRRTGFWGGDGAGAGAEGVVVQQPSGGLSEVMVMPTAVQDEGVICAMAELPAIVEVADEQPAGPEAEAELEDATETHPHTDGTADTSAAPAPIVLEETLSNQTSTSPVRVCSIATTTIFENPIPHQAPAETITTPQHFEIVPAQAILSYTPGHTGRTRIYSNSDMTSQRIRRNNERVVPNHLDCFVPYMKFLE
jgi:hypothetical protein